MFCTKPCLFYIYTVSIHISIKGCWYLYTLFLLFSFLQFYFSIFYSSWSSIHFCQFYSLSHLSYLQPYIISTRVGCMLLLYSLPSWPILLLSSPWILSLCPFIDTISSSLSAPTNYRLHIDSSNLCLLLTLLLLPHLPPALPLTTTPSPLVPFLYFHSDGESFSISDCFRAPLYLRFLYIFHCFYLLTTRYFTYIYLSTLSKPLIFLCTSMINISISSFLFSHYNIIITPLINSLPRSTLLYKLHTWCP